MVLTVMVPQAWAALSEEVKAEWEAKHKAKCEELGVDPAAPAPVDDKPKKPTKDKARYFEKLSLEAKRHRAYMRISCLF